nr:MAG TPA: hypothetical protein [Inoviridae sp.]
MKTKLRRFTAVLSAMLCMICCVLSAVPAFATDIGTTDNNMTNIRQAITYMKQQIVEKGGTLNGKNYIAFYYYPNDSTLSLCLISMPNDTFNLTNGKYLFDHYTPEIWCDFNKYDYTKWTDYDRFTISISSSTSTMFDGTQDFFIDESSSKSSWHIIDTNMKIFNNGDDVTPEDPNAPVKPFTVSYSRKLSTGMSRSGTLSAPGAKNDGETITNNNIDVTVKLTDEYKQAMQKALDKDPKATQYTYQYVLFITPYDPNIFGTKKAMDGAIYTYLNKSKYVLSTAYGKTKSITTTDSKYDTVSTPDSSSTDTSSSNVGEMTSENADGVANSAFCNGVTPLFGLPIANGANMTNTHTINLENIKGSDKLGEQDILYIVVVGKRYLYETGAEGYAKDFYANNAEFKTFYKELPDNAVASKINGLYGGNGYDFYTVVSDGFSFKDYPDYKPLEINGVEYPTDKPISDMLDDPFPPSKITDYDGLENGTDFDTKEDFDDYINNKKYDEQYGTFNFNLTDISSIFDGSSDFFKFMTASIGILPPIFITILIAFFTIMLAICLVKWVVK